MAEVRAIDSNHLLSRLKPATSKEDFIIHEAIKLFVDSEETIEPPKREDDPIRWIPAYRMKKTPNVHAVTYGVECSRCHCFQSYNTRYCPDCGGYWDGEVYKKTGYAERNLRRFNNG